MKIWINPPPQEYLQSLDQAKSARKREKYANLFELSSDLSNGKFVKNISIYPSLQVTLVHPGYDDDAGDGGGDAGDGVVDGEDEERLQVTLVYPDMTREFENICKILYSERCPGIIGNDYWKWDKSMIDEVKLSSNFSIMKFSKIISS